MMRLILNTFISAFNLDTKFAVQSSMLFKRVSFHFIFKITSAALPFEIRLISSKNMFRTQFILVNWIDSRKLHVLSDTQWLNMYFDIMITIGFDVNSDYMLENGAIELRCNKITDSMPGLVQNNILTNHSCHHWICFYGSPDWIARAEWQYLKLRFYFATVTILLLCAIQMLCEQFKRSEIWSRLLIIDAINVVNWIVFDIVCMELMHYGTVLMNYTPYCIHLICLKFFKEQINGSNNKTSEINVE